MRALHSGRCLHVDGPKRCGEDFMLVTIEASPSGLKGLRPAMRTTIGQRSINPAIERVDDSDTRSHEQRA